MPGSEVFLDYRGSLDFDIIDTLLNKLKTTREFKSLNKTTGKRVYSIIVECLENICKHADPSTLIDGSASAHILVKNENDKIVIKAGNTVTAEDRRKIVSMLDSINDSDETVLQSSYENKIKSELATVDKCAGLGFIYMALKSGNKINYYFNVLNNSYLYFDIEITLNKFIMRKLIIDPKSNSPMVILDPEKNIFMISGESRPPDVREFYEPILGWIDEFGMNLSRTHDYKGPVKFDFNFEYFNSSSGKLILDICKKLTGLHLKGNEVKINWHFEKDDFDMLEAGKELSKIVRFPFEYVETDDRNFND